VWGYVGPMDAPAELKSVVVRGRAGGLRQEIEAGGHHLVSDEPLDLGGTDAGPTPYDLLVAALGSCTAITLQMYARHKGWPLLGVEVRLRHAKIHARDCADCETKEGRIDHIDREIVLQGALDDAQRARLLEIADRCPVHRTLTSEINISTRLL
jgi:putative redox protein